MIQTQHSRAIWYVFLTIVKNRALHTRFFSLQLPTIALVLLDTHHPTPDTPPHCVHPKPPSPSLDKNCTVFGIFRASCAPPLPLRKMACTSFGLLQSVLAIQHAFRARIPTNPRPRQPSALARICSLLCGFPFNDCILLTSSCCRHRYWRHPQCAQNDPGQLNSDQHTTRPLSSAIYRSLGAGEAQR